MTKKLAAKKRRAVKKLPKASSSKSKKTASKQTKKSLDPSAKRFVRDLLIRGEASKPSPSGDLPPGATHRIVEDEEGPPTIERERFSLY